MLFWQGLNSLRQRILVAKGPDRELDAAIVVAVTGGRNADTFPGCYWTRNNSHQQAPRVTASLDEAVHLFNDVLPGWNFSLYPEGDGYVAEPTWPEGSLDPEATYFPPTGCGPTRALAICLSIVEALIAQTPSGASATEGSPCPAPSQP